MIDYAKFFAFRNGGAAADVAIDFGGELALFDGQPKRAAQQTDADDCDFLKLHGAKDSGKTGMWERGK